VGHGQRDLQIELAGRALGGVEGGQPFQRRVR
jgi:hypothetical protein